MDEQLPPIFTPALREAIRRAIASMDRTQDEERDALDRLRAALAARAVPADHIGGADYGETTPLAVEPTPSTYEAAALIRPGSSPR